MRIGQDGDGEAHMLVRLRRAHARGARRGCPALGLLRRLVPEVGRVGRAPCGALGGADRQAEPDLAVVGGEDVAAVAAAVHPRRHHRARRRQRTLAPADVLADHPVVAAVEIADRGQALDERGAIGRLVVEEGLRDHPLGVADRGAAEPDVGAQRAEPVRRPLRVDQAQRGLPDRREVVGGGDGIGPGAVGGGCDPRGAERERERGRENGEDDAGPAEHAPPASGRSRPRWRSRARAWTDRGPRGLDGCPSLPAAANRAERSAGSGER
jgi:hypothetical protein